MAPGPVPVAPRRRTALTSWRTSRWAARAAGSTAIATLLGASAIARRGADAGGVAAIAAAGVASLVYALVRARPAAVSVAAGLLALAVAGGNGSARVAVPAQAAALVLVALLAWWSIDERPDLPAGGEVDQVRRVMTIGLVTSAAVVAGIVVTMSSVPTAGLLPGVGAAGAVAVTAGLWSLVRWQRFQEDGRR